MRTCPRCGEGLPERSRFCPGCGAPVAVAPPARERRKVVTVVFADVVGSTALGERVDPETLRWALRRWFERMRAELERHGGRVEKFIGDAVVAVFGLPAVHEDDALRAVRAAAAMRAETERLGAVLRDERGVEIAVRIGIATGEAVTGDAAAGGSFATGDVMNLAARLQQAARPGETLVGHETFRLVRHAVDAEPVTPLTLRGKAATVTAHRLLAVAPDAAARRGRPHAPMVGRARERRRLADAFEQAVAERSCQLFTVVGAPGVGKSRLVAEGLQAIGGTSTIAAGRCLPYGDGLTWWPLVEALGHGLLSACERDIPEPVGRVRGLLNGTGAAVAAEDAFWAVRKVLEALARRRPLVLVIDDLQWAEPTFVDLVEHVAEWSRGVPLLLLVMARPELLDHRPGWGGGKVNATSVLLEPLHEHETRVLLGHLLGSAPLDAADAGRIIRVAEGNPLYVEEFVAMLLDERAAAAGGDGDGPAAVDRLAGVAVPPTIQALLAARLDALGDAERAVLEAASVEGAEFARERVDALLGRRAGGSVAQHLRALVRKDLIRPVVGLEGTFRFRHQLIRDAAYDGLSKA
ncbi:MAG TPA: AAA family ATPase, partial [Solirubrobacteraceae bacterium]|nr:AAA family ATPase [Solirubrobacteraceae bacterium]